jgi:hypothetical protein
VGEILEDQQPVLDDVVRLASLDVRDETDAAGIVLVGRVVETLAGRQAARGQGLGGRGSAWQTRVRHVVFLRCAAGNIGERS